MLPFTNISKLRNLVQHADNPELRVLETQLHQCLVDKENKNALVDKRVRESQEREAQRKYSYLEQQHDILQQEQQQLQLICKQERTTVLALRQREQAAERALHASGQRCADIAADMALARDVEGELSLEKCRAQEEKLCAQEELTKQLQLHRQRQAVIAAANAFANLQLQRSEELECSKRQLQEAVQQKQQVLTRLQHHRRAAALVGEVELHRALNQEARDLREAVEEAEHQEQQQQRLDHLQQARQLAEACLMKDLQQQIRDKNSAAEREKQAEEEYLDILSAVQQLECNLEQLTSAARRRRQLQQRDEAAKLLQVRRLQQRSKQLQQQHDDNTLHQYHSLRSALSLAEEQSLLLQCAPHLLPHFTPALLQRLKNIGSTT